MALIPWSPFKDLDVLRREMDRVWDRFLTEKPIEWLKGGWAPSLDVSETKDNVIVQAEVPGIDTKDIDISLSRGILTIKGEKKQEREEKEENYHVVERSYGSLSRSVHLPTEVQEDKVRASYKNGILKIILPKSEQTKKREIKIEVK